MICPPCRDGGEALRLGLLRAVVELQHQRCPAITSGARTRCDCQHSTEEALNKQLVKP